MDFEILMEVCCVPVQHIFLRLHFSETRDLSNLKSRALKRGKHRILTLFFSKQTTCCLIQYICIPVKGLDTPSHLMVVPYFHYRFSLKTSKL